MMLRTWVPAGLVVLATTVCCSSASSPDVATSAGAVDASSGWTGCAGSFDTHESPTGAYFVTDFGCSSAPAFTDSSDNCCPSGVVAAASVGLCHAGTTTAGCTDDVGTSAAIACERAVNWFSTGGSTFGLGTRLRLTRPDNGKSVVVFVLDNGPACYREEQFKGFALDISYPAIVALYGGEEGVSDHKTVSVTVVPASTPLGIVGAAVDAGDAGVDFGDTPDASATADAEADAAGGQEGGSSGNDAGKPDASAGDTGSEADAGSPPADAGSPGPACTSDGDCNPGSDGSGQYCKLGFCVAGCDADWECPGNTSCVDGTCQ